MQAIMECSKFLCNRDDRNILYSGICKTTCDAQIGAGPVCHEWAGGYCRKIQNCNKGGMFARRAPGALLLN